MFTLIEHPPCKSSWCDDFGCKHGPRDWRAGAPLPPINDVVREGGENLIIVGYMDGANGTKNILYKSASGTIGVCIPSHWRAKRATKKRQRK